MFCDGGFVQVWTAMDLIKFLQFFLSADTSVPPKWSRESARTENNDEIMASCSTESHVSGESAATTDNGLHLVRTIATVYDERVGTGRITRILCCDRRVTDVWINGLRVEVGTQKHTFPFRWQLIVGSTGTIDAPAIRHYHHLHVVFSLRHPQGFKCSISFVFASINKVLNSKKIFNIQVA